jgi:hypothetical protein
VEDLVVFPVFGYGVFRFGGRMPVLMFDRLCCGDVVVFWSGASVVWLRQCCSGFSLFPFCCL